MRAHQACIIYNFLLYMYFLQVLGGSGQHDMQQGLNSADAYEAEHASWRARVQKRVGFPFLQLLCLPVCIVLLVLQLSKVTCPSSARAQCKG